MTSEMMPKDAKIMGTPEEAAEKLAGLAAQWRQLRQPLMADAKEHKRVERAEHECRFQLANAALLWLWHRENTRPSATAPDLAHLLDRTRKAADQCQGNAGAAKDPMDRAAWKEAAQLFADNATALSALQAEVREVTEAATSAANGLDEMVKAIETKSVYIASPIITGQGDPEFGYESWQWHEEWLHYAKRDVERVRRAAALHEKMEG